MGVLGLGRGEGHWRNDLGPKEAELTACGVLRAWGVMLIKYWTQLMWPDALD